MRPYRQSTNSVQIQGFYDDREFSISSIISYENCPRHVLDHLNEIYIQRNHQRCITVTYLTLLSMSSAVVIWMIYWMVYEHCQRILSKGEISVSCPSVVIFQMLIFVSLGLIPIFFTLMIIFWMRFSCSNPIDRIRNNFIGFRIEGDEWQRQLNDHFRYCCSSRTQKNLLHRYYGYIILSPYGIVFDEVFLMTSSNRFIKSGILMDNNRTLKLELNKYFSKEIFIYLPEQIINHEFIEEMRKTLRINIDSISLSRF